MLQQLAQNSTKWLKGKPVRIGARQLSRETASVLSRLYEGRGELLGVVTFRGVPRFLLVPIDQDELLNLALAGVPDLETDVKEAHAALAEGKTYDVPMPATSGRRRSN